MNGGMLKSVYLGNDANARTIPPCEYGCKAEEFYIILELQLIIFIKSFINLIYFINLIFNTFFSVLTKDINKKSFLSDWRLLKLTLKAKLSKGTKAWETNKTKNLYVKYKHRGLGPKILFRKLHYSSIVKNSSAPSTLSRKRRVGGENELNLFKSNVNNLLPLKKFKLTNDRKKLNLIKYLYKDKGIVYVFVNHINFKVYVGSTFEFQRRFYQHLLSTGKQSNIHLQNSFKKYGVENFSLYIVSTLELSNTITSEEKKNLLIPLEQQFIDKFPENQRYNMSPTAGSILGLRRSVEFRVKKSMDRLGKPALNLGMKWTEKQKQLLKEAYKNGKIIKQPTERQLKNLKDARELRTKPVYFYKEGIFIKMYPSIEETIRVEKCGKAYIYNCLKTGKLFRGYRVTTKKEH